MPAIPWKTALGEDPSPRGLATAMGSGDLLPVLRDGRALTLTVSWSRPVPPSRHHCGHCWRWSCVILGCCSLWSTQGMCHFSTCLACLNSTKEQKPVLKGSSHMWRAPVSCSQTDAVLKGWREEMSPTLLPNEWMGSRSLDQISRKQLVWCSQRL